MGEPGKSAPHPLLVGGDAKTGWIFVEMLLRLPLNDLQRTNRGFDMVTCNRIRVGKKSVTKEAIQQLLFDFYTSFPKEAKPGTAEYLLLKSIVNGDWNKIEDQAPQQTLIGDFLKPTPVPSGQLRQTSDIQSEIGLQGRRKGPELKATVNPVHRPISEVTSVVKRVALKRKTQKQLPKIVVGEPKVPLGEKERIQKRKSTVPNRPWEKQIPSVIAVSSMQQVLTKSIEPIRRDVTTEKGLLGEDIFVGEDYFIIGGKSIPFTVQVKSRFWGNWLHIRAEMTASTEEILLSLGMSADFFGKIQTVPLLFTPMQAFQLAKGLGVSIERLLE